jgi:hypothetical protein
LGGFFHSHLFTNFDSGNENPGNGRWGAEKTHPTLGWVFSFASVHKTEERKTLPEINMKKSTHPNQGKRIKTC